MVMNKIETVCGYSCSECSYLWKECTGCGNTRGKPFWTQFAGVDICPIYDCCVNDRMLAHCGKCPELICERFTRFKDPGLTEEETRASLRDMEQELRQRSRRESGHSTHPPKRQGES
jgi:hypothetical protein